MNIEELGNLVKYFVDSNKAHLSDVGIIFETLEREFNGQGNVKSQYWDATQLIQHTVLSMTTTTIQKHMQTIQLDITRFYS